MVVVVLGVGRMVGNDDCFPGTLFGLGGGGVVGLSSSTKMSFRALILVSSF